MQEKVISSQIWVCQPEELTAEDRQLIDQAIASTEKSYSPYSHFRVGAAVRLANGEMISGCNQENAAFSVTVCAERTALFSAGSQYPDEPVCAIAIAARNAEGLLRSPITPCGSCRQAMIETETRSHRPLRILLYGTDYIYLIQGIKTLMPLSFDEF